MPSRRQKGIPPVSETRDGPAISADSSTPLYKDHSESADSQTPLDPEKPSHDDTCSALLALLCCRNSSTGENVERVVFINDQERNKELGYVDNTISNTKYTVLNFIPKNLAEQFRYVNQSLYLIALNIFRNLCQKYCLIITMQSPYKPIFPYYCLSTTLE